MADGTATQNTVDTAPVFAPDGSVRQIPYQQLRDALNSGGKLAVQMQAPNGDVHYVPHDQIGAASQAGGKVNSEQGTIAQPKPQEGFWHSLGSVFGLTPEDFQAAQKKAANLSPLQEAFQSTAPPNPVDVAKSAGTAVKNEFQKGSQEGQESYDALHHGDIKGFLAHQLGQVGHAAATVAAPVTGENLSKAGEQLGQGNVKGALGTATGLIAPVVAGGIVGEKPVPRSALSKTIKPANPVEFHAAEQSAIPRVQQAAADAGQKVSSAADLLTTTDKNGVTKLGLIDKAKQNVLLEAHNAAGTGKTIADLSPDQMKPVQQELSALDTLKQHLSSAQDIAAKNADLEQPTRGEAAGQILKGAAKVATGAAVDAVAPGLGHAAGVLGLFKGAPEVVSGIKNLFAKRALTPENLDASIQQTFGSVEPAVRSGVPADVPGKPAFQPASDLSVQHEGNIAPPETPHGEAAVYLDRPNPAIVSSGSTAQPQASRPISIGPNERPVASTTQLDSTLKVNPAEPQAAPVKQPLKATTPAAQTAEVLKKAGVQQALKDAGVAAPSATIRQIRPGIEVGPTLTPRMDLTFYGDKTGEGASLMQLTRYNINELRAMAVQRGLDVSPTETHVQLIEKIHDDLSPQEIKEFSDAAAERGRFSPPAKAKRGSQPQAAVQLQAGTEEPPVSAPATPPSGYADWKKPFSEIGPQPVFKSAKRTVPTNAAELVSARAEHSGAVFDAISSGQDVPANVLKEYGLTPDTAKQYVKLANAGKYSEAKAIIKGSGEDLSAPPERRTNLDYRQAIDAMSPEEQVKALYQSDKTELPNKRAFDWVEKTRGPAKAIGMSDADGLKAMNDKHGYAAGDALLKAKADALREAGLEAFHDKGDEFLFRGDSPEDMAAKLDKAKDILQNKIIEFKDSQGNVRHFFGAQFSYGTGSDLSAAEAALKANKSGRKASGAAAGRGEMGSIKEVKP